MKILHVITGLRKAAGTSVFCGEVCNKLVALGHEVTIAVVNPEAADCYPIDSRIRLTSIGKLFTSIQKVKCLEFDVIHIHALWEPILHKVAAWARHNKLAIVWSPHGMLTPWAMANKKCKKLLGWWLYQRWDLKMADMIHVTALSEIDDVRRMGLTNRVVIVPLGVKIDGREEFFERPEGKKVLLFVSRVQRKKGLLNLVGAWAQLPSKIKHNWKVRIVGPDQEGHVAELKNKCIYLSVEKDFEFCGPEYGDCLAREYATADLFVLPTHSENFGSVVIEALARSVPVITTKGAPWEELIKRQCGWWIDIGVEPLADALKAAMALDDAQRREMGARGRALVEEKYTWDAVVKAMVKGYEEVLNGRA